MAEEFDIQAAKDKHYRLMDKLVWTKNQIIKATDYYDYPPQDAEKQKELLKIMYDAAKAARDELDKVVNELYY